MWSGSDNLSMILIIMNELQWASWSFIPSAGQEESESHFWNKSKLLTNVGKFWFVLLTPWATNYDIKSQFDPSLFLTKVWTFSCGHKHSTCFFCLKFTVFLLHKEETIRVVLDIAHLPPKGQDCHLLLFPPPPQGDPWFTWWYRASHNIPLPS